MKFTIKLYASGSWKYLKYLAVSGQYMVRSFTSENLARNWAEKNCKGSEGVSWVIYEEFDQGSFPTNKSLYLQQETENLLSSTWRKFIEIIS